MIYNIFYDSNKNIAWSCTAGVTDAIKTEQKSAHNYDFLQYNCDTVPNGEDWYINSDGDAVVEKTSFKTATLDGEIEKSNKKPDFIKIDVEGTELEVLKGASKCLKNLLGVEIESCFFPLRKDQPLVNDVIAFFAKRDFEFIDFLSIIRWERQKYRYTGQPQIADLLFLLKPEVLIQRFNTKIYSKKILINYVAVLTVYLRSDYLRLLNEEKSIRKVIPELTKLCELVEKKVGRINLVEDYSNILKNKIYNL